MATTQTSTAETILTTLTRATDPEYGVNVIDLGYVYGIDVDRGAVVIQMTLPTRDYPGRDDVLASIRTAIARRHPDVTRVEFDLVWEPAWRDDFITDEGRLQMRSPIPQGGGALTADAVTESLMLVLDPEVGINIVDLGLVYDVLVEGNAVHVVMTLTTPGCPLHASIEAAVRRVIETRHPDVADIQLELVWNPPWDPDMISDAGKAQLGWF